ncbi:hypothetical protein AAF712_003356 [Marasmius tenuissimus]|uniref:Uncharacterized protein n=1 Tax=Marasmius tenuissimus TaxID=585030 RepID=A0ABR3A8I7_9AGAR
MGTVPIPGHSSGRTPVYFASQGRKAAPPTTAFGRSYPMRYIEPNLQSTAGPGSCNNDPQKCILHMTGTLSLCSPLRCPLQGEIPHENSQRFSHEPPANVIAAIPLSSTGLSLQRILNREIHLPPAIGPLEVDRRVVPGHEMRIMIALPGFRSGSIVDLTVQCDHGRLTLDGLLYNTAVLIQGFLDRGKGHSYHPGYPCVKDPCHFFVKSLYRVHGEDVWRAEVVLLI